MDWADEPRPERLRGILENNESTRFGERHNDVPVRGASKEMDREQGLRARRDTPLDSIRIDVEVVLS